MRAVETHGALVQVWPVDMSRLTGWLRTRAKRLKLDVENDALEIIAERTEGNLLAADQELQKLRMIARTDKVSAEDVLGSVADSARFDVFRSVNALCREMPREPCACSKSCAPKAGSRRSCSGRPTNPCVTCGARCIRRAAAGGAGRPRVSKRADAAPRNCILAASPRARRAPIA